MSPTKITPSGLSLARRSLVIPRQRTYKAEVLADSPHLYWRGRLLASDVLPDSSGNGLDGYGFRTPSLSAGGPLVGDPGNCLTFAAPQKITTKNPFPDPSFEPPVGGSPIVPWTVSSANGAYGAPTFSLINTWSADGSWSARLTATTTGGTGGFAGADSLHVLIDAARPVSIGLERNIIGLAGGSHAVYLKWWDSSNNFISQTRYAQKFTTGTDRVKIENVTPPGGAYLVCIAFAFEDTSTAGTVDAYVDSLTLNQQATIDSYSAGYIPFVQGTQRTFEWWQKRTSMRPGALDIPWSGGFPILYASETGDVVLWKTYASGPTWTAADPSASGLWRLYDLTVDDGAGTAELYINGVSKGVKTGLAAWGSGTVGVGPFALGTDWSGNDFIGSLDEVAVYHSILPASRVAAHYNRGLGL